MTKNIITINGIVLNNSKAIITYLNTVCNTFVSTSMDLNDPCYVWYDGYKINIESWHPYISEEFGSDSMYAEFDNIFEAWNYICREYTKELNRQKYGMFEFNNEAVVNIRRPILPFRKPRREPNYDVTKTTLFRAPREDEEDRYMPVYSF